MSDLVLNRLLSGVAKRCPAQQLPDTYLVFDTETNGTDVYTCRILQAGLCFVKDGKVVDKLAFLIKRPADMPIPEEAFKVHGLSHAKLAAEGMEPEEAIAMISDTFAKWREQGHMFMGHNLIAFDAPLFELEAKMLGKPWAFGEDEVIDTGMLVKGAQLGMYFRDDEVLRSFYRRVAEVRAKGVRWSLDRYCVPTYDLIKYGIDTTKMHDAGEDCVAAHYLFQEIKKRSSCGI